MMVEGRVSFDSATIARQMGLVDLARRGRSRKRGLRRAAIVVVSIRRNWGPEMRKMILSAAIAGLAAPLAAGDYRMEINNTYPLDQEYFTFSDRSFLIQDNQGWFEVVEGPLVEGPARCIGSGFGYGDGTNTIAGICIFGEAADTFTLAWKAGERGAANDWTIIEGTGRYAGMTGKGVATTDMVTVYRALPLRQTHIVGTITLPDD